MDSRECSCDSGSTGPSGFCLLGFVLSVGGSAAESILLRSKNPEDIILCKLGGKVAKIGDLLIDAHCGRQPGAAR